MGTQEQSRGQNACLWARCTCSYAPGCCKDTARTETQVTGLVDCGHISDFLILVYFCVPLIHKITFECRVLLFLYFNLLKSVGKVQKT